MHLVILDPCWPRQPRVRLDTHTWGVKSLPITTDQLPRWVLYGHNHTAGGPRTKLDDWTGGELDIVLCELTTPFYKGTAPHWPDEIAADAVIYPHRFGITPVTRARVSASPTGPLGADTTHALRSAGIQNRGVHSHLDLDTLLAAAGVELPDGADRPDLSHTAGTITDRTEAAATTTAPRNADPEFRHVVEQHAVHMAIQHMHALGWRKVTPLGKPFDLVCTNDNGAEKHVEVKGTSGAGAEVLYTPNEVHHFRTCPYGADLIVVRDITVDTTAQPYTSTGGELLHIADYTAPPEHLQASQWSGQVNGWQA